MRLVRLALIQIVRDTHTNDKLVPLYEVPMLKLIHGDDDRCQVLDENAGTIELELNDQDEYNRLGMCYGRNNRDAFNHVYRNVQELGELINRSLVTKVKTISIDAPLYVAPNDVAPAPKKVAKKAVKKSAK